ncbi:Dipeptidyl peptidase 9 [Amphibalanus amphitrite]|uniref:Dipeptidyl peptidase 9 n=1 Tax=Amphibalanus amphitrite TaxID=1232801 RepID=A0A6A4WTH7_AMPAM|nr:dipeptidyl peptidase 9-like isoform X1 [Amphibalanus amphitrite]XP_043206779.1 dipeptidyl peptidase 9-like isoform X1 [Amphibalanus amphitrite]XP_043206780.1 dipeptidyl peptidase 9-like isoform X1 [Amphibalanus amphitrite]XP_043206781.1 dipeptidyl peptidase 9-like isoform X1 [Amphibalanus amphitrite]XP_043206782.1 dipeptidyl peptidase 9-like isoform X1 [Amphibalanus amphitrite]XP_043206783.1 dipeptidyl peptidase 9-like isoform X2 [Amphibalanus amphitrite]KAF0305391.1 Dipeptidyl peptidase 9
MSGQRSWAEMRQTLHQLRRSLSALSSRTPQHFSFRALADGRLRVYYLSARAGSENQLCYVDVPPETAVSDNVKLPWQQLFDPTFQSVRYGSRSSRAEQLQLERKRVVGCGITEYGLHEKSGRFIFTAGNSVYHVTDDSARASAVYPVEIPSTRGQPRLNPTICPANPDLLAYVEEGDIWLFNTRTESDVRLTRTHQEDDALSAGFPSYVMQEEFSRFVGFWWAPTAEDGVYRILYEEVDETHVEVLYLHTMQEGSEPEAIRYPRAGSTNATSALKLLEFRLEGPTQTVTGLTRRHLSTPLASMFPWMEYLVRVGWFDDQFVHCQLLDRSQCRLDLVLVPVALFVADDATPGPPPPPAAPVQVLLSAQTDVWINVHDIFHVIPTSDPGQVCFLWMDDTTGYTHLYRVTTQITRQPGSRSASQHPAVTKVPLTSGQWSLDSKQIWVSEKRGLVFFQGSRDTPVERHLYVTSFLQPSGKCQQLTQPGFYHNAYLDSECTALVTVQSNLSTPPSCQVWRLHSSSNSGEVQLLPAGVVLEPCSFEPPRWLPQLHSCRLRGSGDQLFAMVYPPTGFVPGRRYPTVVNVYGGPQVQVVTNTFKGYRYLRNHILAAEGYCVVCIDSRGSHNRGTKFEGHIKNRMGTVEIADQVDALHQLADRTGMIDLSRVAIQGWSYGGYLSLMGLALRPDVFKLAVPGAPVVSWSLYDTGYTERYMDLPCRNPCGYEAGAVLSYANQFPSEPNRLLIFHGLMDENVHFFHTQQLISALIRAGKPYQLQVYPNERHSLRALESSEHYELTLLTFLNNHL